MAFLGGFRSRRLARRAEQAYLQAGWEAARAALAGAGGLAAGAWATLAVALYNRGHRDEAGRAVAEALAADPDRGDALIFQAELHAESGRLDEAIATYRHLLARFPGAGLQALELARLLAGQDRFQEAREVLVPFAAHPAQSVRVELARIHVALGGHAAAIALLAPIVREMRVELQGALYGQAREELVAEYQEVGRLHDDAYAALHGREKVIESAVARGDLDARAGVNYKLLGEARMVRPPRWTPDTRLRSVEDGHAFGEALVASGESSRGLCQMGVAELRRGRLEYARRLFDRTRAEDDGNFAAYLGLGAAMDLERSRAFERLAALHVTDAAPPELERVVVDWPALTPLERKVVVATAAPLAPLLPRLVAAGAVARILPIDARLTDLPEMDEAPEERSEDHRCLEAITGAANELVCASKIEDLLDVTGEHDSVFAHELAHLVHCHAPPELQDAIDELYARAVDEEHVLTAYQTTNPAEFFAVACTDYLAHRYDLPSRRERDDGGIVDEAFALIDGLGRGSPE